MRSSCTIFTRLDHRTRYLPYLSNPFLFLSFLFFPFPHFFLRAAQATRHRQMGP
nr:Hypothetical protein [Pseudomonas aeruginosa]